MAKTTTIAGNTFLFTGKLTEFTREDAEAHVEAEGGKVLSGVSAKLNYLVVGEDAGSKLKKAEALGTVTILHEKEFLKMMSSGKKAPGKSATNKATNKDNAAAKTAANKISSDKVYEEVQIGKQIWMAKNLDVTHFRNGDPIPEARTNKEWEKARDDNQPALCFYDNKDSNGKQYGKLYNWHAVNDPRGLAPKGYHIPSDEEWTILTDYLGGGLKAGKKMKSSFGWDSNSNGTNSSGFEGLPGGLRNDDGPFNDIGYYGIWWSSEEFGKYNAWYRDLSGSSGSVSRSASQLGFGFSVRCTVTILHEKEFFKMMSSGKKTPTKATPKKAVPKKAKVVTKNISKADNLLETCFFCNGDEVYTYSRLDKEIQLIKYFYRKMKTKTVKSDFLLSDGSFLSNYNKMVPRYLQVFPRDLFKTNCPICQGIKISPLNKKDVLNLVRQDWKALQFLSSRIKSDKDVVFETIKQNGTALQFASKELQANKGIVMEAVKQKGNALQFASKELQANKGIVMEAVKEDGYALPFASKELQANKGIVMEAVKENGYALQFASKELKTDKEIVLAAVKQNGMALEYASKLMQGDKEIVKFAVAKDNLALQFATNDFKVNAKSDGGHFFASLGRTENQLTYFFDISKVNFKDIEKNAKKILLDDTSLFKNDYPLSKKASEYSSFDFSELFNPKVLFLTFKSGYEGTLDITFSEDPTDYIFEDYGRLNKNMHLTISIGDGEMEIGLEREHFYDWEDIDDDKIIKKCEKIEKKDKSNKKWKPFVVSNLNYDEYEKFILKFKKHFNEDDIWL